MEQEVKALMKKETWTAVRRPKGVKVIDTRWVYKVKRSSDNREVKFKSRLVARGFSQEYGVNYFETYAPVVKNSSVRMLMAIAAKCELKVQQIDVKNAYVNSELEEDVYISEPEGFAGNDHGVALKLSKSLYGLKQSGNQWNKTLNKFLVEKLKFRRLKTDSCVYVKRENQHDMIIIAVYVDDIIIYAKEDSVIEEFKRELNDEFEIDDIGQCRKVIGMRVECGADTVTLSQSDFALEIIKECKLEACRTVRAPLEPGERLQRCETESSECNQVDGWFYRSIVGKLNYLASTTRPDLMFSLSYLSQFTRCPHRSHMEALKRVVRYLSGTYSMGLKYNKSGPLLEAFCDSDWAGSPDRRSYTGYVIKMSGGSVGWEAKKQPTIALSSTEAEYMALTSAAKELLHLDNLIAELNIGELYDPGEMILKIDNKGAMALATNNGYSPRTKHIDVRHHFVRELCEGNVLKLEYVCSKENVADICTKPLNYSLHKNLMEYVVDKLD